MLLSAVRGRNGWYKTSSLHYGQRQRIRSCHLQVHIGKMGYPQDQFYTIQDKARINTFTFNDWIDHIWTPFARQQADCHSYLIMDECPVHMKSESIEAIQHCGTEVFFSRLHWKSTSMQQRNQQTIQTGYLVSSTPVYDGISS